MCQSLSRVNNNPVEVNAGTVYSVDRYTHLMAGIMVYVTSSSVSIHMQGSPVHNVPP